MSEVYLETRADTESLSTFKRKLGGLERALHLYSLVHPAHFCIVAEIEGAINPASFRSAFDFVQTRHPLLSVYIDDGAGNGPNFHTADRRIELHLIPAEQEPDWRRVVERELSTPYDHREAPLMRAAVIHGPNHATVVLTFHHSIADALSGAYIAQDLMGALSGQPLAVLPDLPPREELVSRALDSARAAGNEAGSNDRVVVLETADPSLWRPFDGSPPKVSTVVLDRTETETLVRHCREEKTTVHGAICAAVVRNAPPGNEPFRVLTSIDLRKPLAIDSRDCGLLVTSERVDFPPDPGDDFWQLARNAINGLALARSSNGILNAADAVEYFVPVGSNTQDSCDFFALQAYDVAISNLGVFRMQTDFGPLRLKAIWGPAVLGQAMNEQVIGVSTLADQLRMIHTSYEPIPSLLETVRDTLLAA